MCVGDAGRMVVLGTFNRMLMIETLVTKEPFLHILVYATKYTMVYRRTIEKNI